MLKVFLAAVLAPLLAAAQAGPLSRPDLILVKPVTGADLSALNQLLGVQVVATFPAVGNLQVSQVPPGATADSLISLYEQSGLVQYAEHDFYVQALNDPNDFYYQQGNLWNLKNTGQNGGTPGADIRASLAWNLTTTATNTIVAVVDTGVRYTHEDLAGNMWVNPADGSHGTNAIAGTTDPWDDYGHGTHVSGIIGAVGNNGVGIVGVCWQVQIMACKFLDAAGNGTISGAIACIDFARAHGAKVINASWGSFTFTSQALRDAIASARDADIIFVAAGGNSAANNDVTPLYPASYSDLDNVVSVAATDPNDNLASFSDYGLTNVSLAAPGTPIFSCWNGSDRDYEFDNGTSMAAAHVSGAVALLRGYFQGENHRQIIRQILNGTDPLPGLVGKCASGGRLDVAKSLGVTAPLAPPAPPPLPGLIFNEPSWHALPLSSPVFELAWWFGDTLTRSAVALPQNRHSI